eukprot:CAMPEP_0180178052 /NCGR_PEP_ID=MMETSP0986-20121125/38191_1 /TAXON_ID=697907 /ORGANISM="non described non described, Strain CCMP2293" /LENGTH=137 /DNA_ID=CAMNT_0022130857 /DNA_START=235 /DNA_END=646 /DNA_ORIENTATION=-
MATYASMKIASQSAQAEEKRAQERRKALVVLIIRHLCDHGYVESAEKLQAEAQVSLSQTDAADNIDMLSILQEYEEFYEIRFQRKPKLTRKVGAGDMRSTSEQAKLPNVHRAKEEAWGAGSNNDDEGGGNGGDPHKP